MKLSEAEVVVTTQQQIEKNTHEGNWFQLSNYGDTEEFYEHCRSYFPDEVNPSFRYPAWENIPDQLINKEWFSPNFFEFRDALERIDESETDYFLSWCEYHGHNIAEDDPYQLVAHYQETNTPYPDLENEEPEIYPDAISFQNSTSMLHDTGRYSVEVFDDNYD